MRELAQRLQAWVEAGLVTAEQARQITAFEADTAERTSTRSTLAEVVGYVGAALAVGALALLLGDLWDDLTTGGQLTLVALLTLLLGAAGATLRGLSAPAMQRLASVLFTGAVIGAGWSAYLVGTTVMGWARDHVALAVALTVLAVALPLYLLRPRFLPQLTLFVAVLLTVAALFAQLSLEPGRAWVGLSFWGLAMAWLLLGLGGWVQPARGAELLGGVAALFAVLVTAWGSARVWLLLLGLATAAALVGLALVGERVQHLAVGAVGLFVFVPQLVFEVFGEVVGAAATLLIVGLLLVLLAIGLGRAGRELTGARGRVRGSPPDTGDPARDTTPVGGVGS